MIKLIYTDVGLGADEDAEVTTSSAENFSDTSKIPFGVETPPIITGEPNGWGLIHDYIVRDNQPFAFWSTDRSGEDCVFSSPPTITLEFTSQYTSTGLTVRFAPNSMDYCRKLSVSWYQGETIKDALTLYPTLPNFVINNSVEAFDKIVFTFLETSLPGKRCKVDGITVGVIREFDSSELTSVQIIKEVDLISNTIPMNVLDAAIHSKEDVDYIFQRKQPVNAYDGDTLLGRFYIEKGSRTGAKNYKISTQDKIGIFDLAYQNGGIWFSDTPLTDILTAIFGDTSDFEIDSTYSNSMLRGYIAPGTKREALRQIAFALGAVVDTMDKVKIFPQFIGTGENILPQKTFIGGSEEISDTVTEVTVSAYVITDERPGEKDEYIEYNGVQYKYYTDTKHAYNSNAVSGDAENIVNFTGMYLCNPSNSQMLADQIMAYYQRRRKYNFSHVLDGQEPAKRYNVTFPWGDSKTGNISKMTLKISGIAVSSSEMFLD